MDLRRYEVQFQKGLGIIAICLEAEVMDLNRDQPSPTGASSKGWPCSMGYLSVMVPVENR